MLSAALVMLSATVVILSEAKDLSLGKEPAPRGVYPERSEWAQGDTG